MSNIYLLRNEMGRYKIGISVDVERRVKGLMFGGGIQIELLKTWKSSYASTFEECFHARYVDYHHLGEWFNIPFNPITDMDELLVQGESFIKRGGYCPDKIMDSFAVRQQLESLISMGQYSHKRSLRSRVGKE